MMVSSHDYLNKENGKNNECWFLLNFCWKGHFNFQLVSVQPTNLILDYEVVFVGDKQFMTSVYWPAEFGQKLAAN